MKDMTALKKLDWIVVPGGPGISNKYIAHGLACIEDSLNLHFYDQLGSPENSYSTVPDINNLVDEIIEFAHSKDLGTFGLITHSFGNYIAIRLLEKAPDLIEAMIMISPMPFRYDLWKKALSLIVATVPPGILNKFTALAKNDDGGVELFKTLLPYYVANPDIDLPVEIPFDMAACNAISAKVHDYDDEAILTQCDKPITIIYGEEDPFYLDKTFLKEKTLVVPNIGHYPFLEDNTLLQNLFNDIMRELCQADQAHKMTTRFC